MRTERVLLVVVALSAFPARLPGQVPARPLPPLPPQTPEPRTLALTRPPARPPAPPPPAADEEGLTVRGSSVGYIDTAVPGDQVVLRTEFGYGFRFPSRAEFFYAQGRPGGPGLPLPERSVDYRDLTLYAETLLAPRASVFVEGGVRFLDPVVNANAAGLGDMNVGFKYGFWAGQSGIATFQFRTYVPTGDPHHGLGTAHVSLEPGLLGYTRLADRLGVVGELRYWIPAGGTDFAGTVLRYGLGFRYDLWQRGEVRVTPVTEVIGWTALGGRQPGPFPGAPPGGAAGTSIVNVKVGGRLDVTDRAGFYLGYGRAITGERWYTDVLRFDVRWLY